MDYNVVIDRDFQDLIPTFLKGRIEDIVYLKENLSSKDYETLGYIGHKIKGAGYNYGFEKIGEIGKEIEVYSKMQNKDKIESLINQLENYIDNINIKYEEM